MTVSSSSAITSPKRKPIRSLLRCDMPCRFERHFPKLADDVGPILLGGQATAHHRKLLLGEGHSSPTLTRYLDETRFRAPAISRARALRSLM